MRGFRAAWACPRPRLVRFFPCVGFLHSTFLYLSPFFITVFFLSHCFFPEVFLALLRRTPEIFVFLCITPVGFFSGTPRHSRLTEVRNFASKRVAANISGSICWKTTPRDIFPAVYMRLRTPKIWPVSIARRRSWDMTFLCECFARWCAASFPVVPYMGIWAIPWSRAMMSGWKRNFTFDSLTQFFKTALGGMGGFLKTSELELSLARSLARGGPT